MATDKSFGCRFANTEKCADSCFKCELFHSDYISREAALACFTDWIDRYGHEHSADEMVEYQRIEELPVADVQPVVLCKDCKYYKEGELLSPTKFCFYYQIGTGLNTADDDFCSNGERRVDE